MILVTGTDTGVGKTFVTISLVKWLREQNRNVCAFKIVETGCLPICEDAQKISEACGKEIRPIYSFKAPVAPSVAADMGRTSISIERIKKEILAFSGEYEEVFFEGAGGLLVPITWEYTFLDLARELGMDVVIVALNKLGVINHTLLTVKACECEGVRVKCVILNTKEKFDESVETNYESLRKLLKIPVYLFSSLEDASNFAESLLD
ncbi:dethiobiotin synthase [Phorcysia thermohydrogeniphila]|uniref:ATP-dependent dethiobiotin synthetase BioD n=1 Tax=Phorcysia thermohydrogeniphila TaxID=936138 RepID=A0A4R1GIB1_9BACT|nr:dethiobiotin synthase [Phorcysia thermohydrogeniphila]TCK06645.1 dethiobiotin synthetase [Phorcysia thermohydrogeniphila]